ncbi:MAG: hypothetical protein IMW98_01245 [Firmicutes bacterium]|nr:hypothetical protein [Bacillota bacterium]
MRPVSEAGEPRGSRPALAVLRGGALEGTRARAPRPARVLAEPWYYTGGAPPGPELLALRRMWGVRPAIWRLYAR